MTFQVAVPLSTWYLHLGPFYLFILSAFIPIDNYGF
jgi:hypothetical protein